MGIRNKVTKDGFVDTKVDGDIGLFGFEQQFVTATTSITTGLTIVSGAGITLSLPTLSTTPATDDTTANGLICTIMLASANVVTLSASSPINGAVWTVACPATAFKSWTCVGVTGLAPTGAGGVTSGWFVTSGTIA